MIDEILLLTTLEGLKRIEIVNPTDLTVESWKDVSNTCKSDIKNRKNDVV